MTDELCEVIITAPDAEWLMEFTRRLVEDHLAASAQTIPMVRSVYRWQGELVDRTEARATVRTRIRHVPSIVARLDDEHPYEVPGVVALPIVTASPDYVTWVLSQTESAWPLEPPR